VEGLARIVKAPKTREKKAEEGLKKLLGRDTHSAKKELQEAEGQLQQLKAKGGAGRDDGSSGALVTDEVAEESEVVETTKSKKDKKAPTTKKRAGKVALSQMEMFDEENP
jgi:DNA topoisomerase VI subunit B